MRKDIGGRAAQVTNSATPQTSWWWGLRGRLPPALAGPGRRAAWRRARLRRGLAAMLIGFMVWLLVDLLVPDRPVPGVPVLVAARDLAAGSRLGAGDVALARWPPSIRPPAALRVASAGLGRRLAAPITAGEAITTTRLSGPGLLAGAAPDVVAAHVALADPAVTTMVHPGDTVDVLSGSDGAVVAAAATVLSVDDAAGAALLGGSQADQSSGLVVAVSREAASAMTRAAAGEVPGAGLSLTLRRPTG